MTIKLSINNEPLIVGSWLVCARRVMDATWSAKDERRERVANMRLLPQGTVTANSQVH